MVLGAPRPSERIDLVTYTKSCKTHFHQNCWLEQYLYHIGMKMFNFLNCVHAQFKGGIFEENLNIHIFKGGKIISILLVQHLQQINSWKPTCIF